MKFFIMRDLIEQNKSFSAFAMIVDINAFTLMVAKGEKETGNIAQFVRDILSGGIEAVEKSGGLVVGFMGDAFLALLEDVDKVFDCCALIAKDLDRTCEYISGFSEDFPQCPKGPKLKIGIEYGVIDVSTIDSDFLGTQKIFIGSTINYASRIMSAGKGNRCLLGPEAYKKGLFQWSDDDPHTTKGKKGEPEYLYYNLDLNDIWRNDPDENYWG